MGSLVLAGGFGMRRHWVITPYNSAQPEIFEKAWEYDVANDTVAIGFGGLGDTADLSEEELTERCRQIWGERYSTRDRNTIWRFYHEMAVGDLVIARRGTKRVVGIGTVAGSPFYDEGKGQERVAHLTDQYYANFIPVEWEKKELKFPKAEFSFYTLYEIPNDRYRVLIEGGPEENGTGDVEQSTESVLERYLEDFIVTNFDSIFGGQLVLYKDQEGSIGQQYSLIDDESREIGRIDILAKEPSTNSFVVIELKKGRGSDEVVGQVLRYMGWVKGNLCGPEESVGGLIICRERDQRLDYALRMVQGLISVKRYSVSFELTG